MPSLEVIQPVSCEVFNPFRSWAVIKLGIRGSALRSHVGKRTMKFSVTNQRQTSSLTQHELMLQALHITTPLRASLTKWNTTTRRLNHYLSKMDWEQINHLTSSIQ